LDRGHLHVEVEAHQISKRPAAPCGDVARYERSPTDTVVVICDGLGSGIKANVAANMCAARLLGLLRQGHSLRGAFASVARTMERVQGSGQPWAAFTVARILSDGMATVLTYEMPPPLFVTRRYADLLHPRSIAVDGAVISEANLHLAPGEGLLLVSDGITQAGLGAGYPRGWGSEGAARHLGELLRDGTPLRELPRRLVSQARKISRGTAGDDCTALLASCRLGSTINILTGPPKNAAEDLTVVNQFLMMDGVKIVCGGTTAKVVARCLGKEVRMEENPQSLLAPPRYQIEGIGLVTEGAVTLNQLYNVLDEDPSAFEEVSGVTELHALVRAADRINIWIGGAENPATTDISFRQQGILSRHKILPLLAKKLQEMGKLVVVKEV